MMEVIGRFAPDQYVYSIDESFLSFAGMEQFTCLRSYSASIRRAVWKECRLPVCVGVGATLTLAKLANQAAKQFKDYNGVCVIDSDDERCHLLGKLSVKDVWGVGSKLTNKLTAIGINTALDFARFPAAQARKQFTIEVERTVRELNGQRCKSWDEIEPNKKQIFSTRSSGDRITELSTLQQALSNHARIASLKARKQHSLCKVMVCFAYSSAFDSSPLNSRAVHHFTTSTADIDKITKAVTQLALSLFKDGARYSKVGVGLIELTDASNEQQDLFNTSENNPTLMGVFDQLNDKFGKNSIFIAAQGTDQRWDMKRNMLTPQYTTNWSHIPIIKC